MNHNKAIEILNKFEYSSDGFPKRYPEEAEFVSALAFLEQNKPTVDGVARFTETFGQLFEEGAPATRILWNKDENRWEMKVDGFYKHGEVTVYFVEDSKNAWRETFNVVGRYGDLDEVGNFDDLADLNYYQWSEWRDRGFNEPNSAWLPFLIEMGRVKEVTKTFIEPA